MGGAYVHIIGAETLKSGTPVDLGWIPLFLAVIGACGAGAVAPQATAQQAMLLVGGAAVLAARPALPRKRG